MWCCRKSVLSPFAYELARYNLHCQDQKCLKQESHRRLPSSQTAVKKTDSRKNEIDDESTGSDVNGVELISNKRRVHIELGRISAIRYGGIIFGLSVAER